MNKHIALMALAAAACNGDVGDKSGETGGTGGCEDVYDGPISITMVDVTCDGADNVRFSAETEGWTAGGDVFAIDTRNVNPFSEEHSLEVYEHDECGFWDRLERIVTTTPYPAPNPVEPGYEADVSSLFSCSDHYEAGQPVMTYAFFVYDDAGALADCYVAGHDAAGLINGDYDDDFITEPTNPIDPPCEAGTLGM
jgi:hypothetical protein